MNSNSSIAPQLSAQQLQSIATEFGTPIYVYHAERIAFQYQKLKDAFQSADAHFFYACKALTNINILKYVRRLGAGLDCVSINEVMLGLKAGFQPEQILFTPNCTDFNEFLSAAALGVNINIDNLPILQQFGKHFGATYPVLIRLNPNILAGGNIKISTGYGASKFGISMEQLPEILSIVNNTQLKVKGLHIHTGSEIKDASVFLEGLAFLFNLVEHFPDLTLIDLGSGFKVPFKKDEKGTDMLQLGTMLGEAFEQFEAKTGRKLKIWFEPGKFLVSECGYLLVKANVVKQTPSKVFVGVNSGFNHLIRPMFYDAYHFIENISHPNGPLHEYTVVGNICETDTFAHDRMLPAVTAEDVLAFYNAGAYGFEMSSNFNARLKPAEVLVLNNNMHLIRKPDTFDNLLINQVEINVL